MLVKDVLNIAQSAGQIILENGGEVYRVEETISRICGAYNINVSECFVTPSVIMISIKDSDDNPITFIKRIKKRTIDMHKIHDINALSRRISETSPPIQEIQECLKSIHGDIHYRQNLQIFASGCVAGCFTLLFGGNPLDFLLSFIIGCLIKLFLKSADRLQMNDFFTNISGGGMASFIALFSSLVLPLNPDQVIIGSIMLLVPGLTITNGIRDTIAGDFYSGIARVIEALFVAIGIALGSVIAFSIFLQVKEIFLL